LPVLNHLSSNHASDANVHGNPYLDRSIILDISIIQHIEDNSCRSAFVVIIVIEVMKKVFIKRIIVKNLPVEMFTFLPLWRNGMKKYQKQVGMERL